MGSPSFLVSSHVYSHYLNVKDDETCVLYEVSFLYTLKRVKQVAGLESFEQFLFRDSFTYVGAAVAFTISFRVNKNKKFARVVIDLVFSLQ